VPPAPSVHPALAPVRITTASPPTQAWQRDNRDGMRSWTTPRWNRRHYTTAPPDSRNLFLALASNAGKEKMGRPLIPQRSLPTQTPAVASTRRTKEEDCS